MIQWLPASPLRAINEGHLWAVIGGGFVGILACLAGFL